MLHGGAAFAHTPCIVSRVTAFVGKIFGVEVFDVKVLDTEISVAVLSAVQNIPPSQVHDLDEKASCPDLIAPC